MSTLREAQELIEAGYDNALQLQDRPTCPNPRCEAFYDWHDNGFCLKNFGCSLTAEEVLANPRVRMNYVAIPEALVATSVFDSVDMTPRTERPQVDPVYLGALEELNKVKGLRAIAVAVPLIAAIFGKTNDQVLDDSCWMPVQAEFDRIHREAGVTL